MSEKNKEQSKRESDCAYAVPSSIAGEGMNTSDSDAAKLSEARNPVRPGLDWELMRTAACIHKEHSSKHEPHKDGADGQQ